MTMFQTVSCRLCRNICHGQCKLYDEDGRPNEVYALTEKYFSPVYLDMECVDQLAVLCMECWLHISEFHTFQQSVALAQKMFAINKPIETVVKEEVAGEEPQAKIRIFSPDLCNTSGSNNEVQPRQVEAVVKREVENPPAGEELITNNEFRAAEINTHDLRSFKTMKCSPNRCNTSGFHNDIQPQDGAVVKMEVEIQPEGEEQSQSTATDVRPNNELLSGEMIDTHDLKSFTTAISTPDQSTNNEGQQQAEAVVKTEVESELDDQEFIAIQPNSRATDVQHYRVNNNGEIVSHSLEDFTWKFYRADNDAIHNEVFSGEIVKHNSENFTNANTSKFSHNPDDTSSSSNEAEVRSPLSYLEKDACSQKSIEKLEQEFIDCLVTGESLDRKVMTMKIVWKPSQNRTNDSCDEVSTAASAPSEQNLDDTARISADEECEERGNFTRINKPRRKNSALTYKSILKRPQSSQDYDDLIAQWRPKLECELCGKSCSSFSLLQQHFAEQHPHEECHIVCCQHKFLLRCEIEKHIRFHLEPTPFKCAQCDRVYSTKVHLTTHLQKVHTGVPLKPYKCPQCPKSYFREGLLLYHRKYRCNAVDKPPSKHGPKRHACTECGKLYKTIKLLRRHSRIVHLGLIKMETLKCSICDKLFNNRANLSEHMTLHAGRTTHACPHCPKTFIGRSTFYSHMNKMHRAAWSEEKKEKDKLKNKKKKTLSYKCTTCADVYDTAEALRQHMAKHSGKPLYSCPLCPEMFLYRSFLYGHFNVLHSNAWVQKEEVNAALGRKFYMCAHCEEDFETHAAWHEHQATHRGLIKTNI